MVQQGADVFVAGETAGDGLADRFIIVLDALAAEFTAADFDGLAGMAADCVSRGSPG